jgi:hypothetical protein
MPWALFILLLLLAVFLSSIDLFWSLVYNVLKYNFISFYANSFATHIRDSIKVFIHNF